MKRKLLLPLLMLVALVVTGCATPYQPHGATGGYKERQLEENKYIVSFFGNGNTSGQIVWNYWMYRCAELTLEKGYEFFELSKSDEHAFLEEKLGWKPVEFTMLESGDAADNKHEIVPAYYSYYTYTVTTYSSKAIVTMYKQPVPKSAGFILDAAKIKAMLAEYVKSEAKSTPPARKDIMIRAAIEASIKAKRIKQEQAERLEKMLDRKLGKM